MLRALGKASMISAPMSSAASPSTAWVLRSPRAGVRRVVLLEVELGVVDVGGRSVCESLLGQGQLQDCVH